MNRQKLILFILLMVFAVAVVTSFLRMPRQIRVSEPLPGSSVSKKMRSGAQADEKKLHLELLAQDSIRFSGYKRNIFQPIFYDEAKYVPPPKIVKPAPPPPPPPPPPSPEEVAAAQLKQEMGQFIFLGFMQKKGAQKIIFLSLRNEIFLVKKGDTIAGKYTVSSLTDEALTIKPISMAAGETTIPLMENKPLVPAQGKTQAPPNVQRPRRGRE